MDLGKEVIVKMKFGSHLYGTNTEKSDTDYKGVFLEHPSFVMLGKTRSTIIDSTGDNDTRNTEKDVDIEFKELQKFLYDAMSGQTYALDMLFAPPSMILERTVVWSFIIANRNKLLSKNVAPFIGYCRQQAGKYGLKGSRLGELERVIKELEKFPQGLPVSEYYCPETEFVKWETKKDVLYLKVLGKYFDRKMRICDVLKSLQQMYDKYGARSLAAKNNNGVDFKAISHAYRCMFQLRALYKNSEIIFPLPEKDYLLKIKAGEIPYSIVQDELPALMDTVMKMPNNLPDEPDRQFWDNYIVKVRTLAIG